MAIELTARDTETGESETQIVPEDSYIVVCAGRAYIAAKQVYPRTGTHQLTIKVDRDA